MTKFNFNEALKHSQQSQNSLQTGFFRIEITVHGKIKDKKKHRKHIRLTFIGKNSRSLQIES